MQTTTAPAARSGKVGRIRNERTCVGRRRQGQHRNVRNTDKGRFGRHLESLVTDAGLTVNEFADRIGKSREAVRTWFRGVSTPPFDDWRIIAKVLRLKNIRDVAPDEPII